MDEQRHKFEAEICRLKKACRETNSEYLRRDYSKAIKRMIRELRTYDSFRAEVR